MLKVLFFGTAEFAIPALKNLIRNKDIQVIGVVTQPDAPFGRKRELKQSPVKEFVSSLPEREIEELKIFQPEKLRKEANEILAGTNPDIIIVAAYGQIIPENMINFPKFGCLNIHGSLLPEYRGAIPIEKALLDGKTKTGVSILKMTPGLDDGEVLVEKEIELTSEDDAVSVRVKLADIGAMLLLESIPKWINGEINLIDQETLGEKFARVLSYCYAAEMTHENAEIKPSADAGLAVNRIRAFSASRGAWISIEYKNKQHVLKIFKARIHSSNPTSRSVGKLEEINNKLILKLPGHNIELVDIQLAGSKRNSGANYLYLVEDTNDNVRVLVKSKGTFVMIRRKKINQEEYFVLPGGHRVKGETVEDAGRRELFEELSLELIEKSELKKINSIYDEEFGENLFYYELNLDIIPELKLGGPEMSRNSQENFYEIVLVSISIAGMKEEQALSEGIRVLDYAMIKEKIRPRGVVSEIYGIK